MTTNTLRAPEIKPYYGGKSVAKKPAPKKPAEHDMGMGMMMPGAKHPMPEQHKQMEKKPMMKKGKK